MRPSESVPVFKLYGEHNWPTPDLIHCESIAERSRLHDWTIKPHRHGDLIQLLYVEQGEAWLEVEGVVSHVYSPSLQVVPPLCVHGFRFSRDVQGHVLSLALPVLERISAPLDTSVLQQAGCYLVGADHRRLGALFSAIDDEYRGVEAGRDLMLNAQLSMLLVWITRHVRRQVQSDGADADRGRAHLQSFNALLEQHFREHWPIDRYAAAIGISAAHLNSLCRRLADQSALQMLNQRLLLEAKRCLVYTMMSVSDVSNLLGFSEPAYFSRFFKQGAGMSPKAFRLQR